MDISQNFINDIFKNSNISEKYLKILTSSMDVYQTAFTSPSYNAQYNYELYEFIGDVEINNAVVTYFYQAFPQLRCASETKIFCLLRNLHVSSDSLSEIARNLNFLPYIKATEEELKIEEKQQKLLEDVFEAFIGATKDILLIHFKDIGPGITSHIIYKFIKSIFDKKEISLKLEDLFDAKTRLKELFDKPDGLIKREFGNLIYNYNPVTLESTLRFYNFNSIVFYGKGRTKQQKEKFSSELAIQYIKNQGFDVSKKPTFHCQNS